MGVYLQYVDHDRQFNESAVPPIIINDIPTVTEEQKAYIDNLIYKRFESDLLSNEPSCECGATTGGYKIGVVCPNCNTEVKNEMEQELQPFVWIRKPQGVQKLIKPVILLQLIRHFNKSNFSLVEWLINTDYTSNSQRPAYVDALLAGGIKRGYNNFVVNMESYLTMMFDIKVFKPKKGDFDPLYHLIMTALKEGMVLSHYIPMVNRSLMVIEETKVGKWVDPIVMGAIDSLRTISSIDDPVMAFTPRQKENRTAKTLIGLAEYYKNTCDEVLSDKTGLWRKHVYGTRNHFSSRNVITSQTRGHRYDELHIPWGAAVTVFKHHLFNKLYKLGYTINSATALLQECVYRYDPLIDSLFNEMFRESRDGGHACLFQRNPSLTRASAQRMLITKVKTDVDDPTIGLSILAVRGFNAELFIGHCGCETVCESY